MARATQVTGPAAASEPVRRVRRGSGLPSGSGSDPVVWMSLMPAISNPNPAGLGSASGPAGSRPRFAGPLAAIAALGLTLRVLYVVTLAGDNPGAGDFVFYHSTANLIARGYGLVDPLALAAGTEVPSAAHPPGWPRLLAVVSAAGGTSVQAHRLTGCVIGAVVIVLAGLLGRRIAGRTVGLLTAGLAALHPTLVAADGSLMSETLYGLLVVWALLLAYRVRHRPGAGAAVLLGLAIGLAALVRAEALLLAPILAAAAVAGLRRPAVDRLLLAGAVCLVTAATVTPWTLRNRQVFGRAVVVSTNGASVVGGANCARTYHGPFTGGWRLECLPARLPGLDEAQEAGRWSRAGRHYALHHVARLPVVAVVRALRTWDLWQPFGQIKLAEGRDRGVELAGVLVYFLLLVPALGGLRLLRRAGHPLGVLAAAPVLVTVSSVLGYGLPRFRHAAEIPLLVLAAIGLMGWRAGRQAAGPGARAPR